MYQVLANNYDGTHDDPIPIGTKDEHDTRTIVFDISNIRETIGDGTWKIIARRSEETEPYDCKDVWESTEGYACWDVSMEDTSKSGYGYVQILYYPTKTNEKNVVFKSLVWVTYTHKSIEERAIFDFEKFVQEATEA